MARRIGVPSLIDLARSMCAAIVKFSPLIQAAYPSNAALQAALSAALAACQVLDQELTAVREFGD